MTDVRTAIVATACLALVAGCSPQADDSATTTITAAVAVQEEGRPEDTEVWEPEPDIVTSGEAGAAPSDAIVLFDGTDLSAWSDIDGGPAGWSVEDGAMTVVAAAGDIQTRQGFGDMQLHNEWRSPAVV